MKLEQLYIGHYKHLTNARIDFHDMDDEDVTLRLFIGKNGSGKSAMIEAIGLIFTRMLQDESPGFHFEIKYKIWSHGKWIKVRAKTDDSVKKLEIWENGQKLNLKESPFSQNVHLHPRRIIAQSSGPISLLDDILMQTPIDALKSDIFDVCNSVEANKDYNQSVAEIQNSIKKMKKINEDAPYLYVDGDSAIFVLITLCAVIPRTNPQEFCDMRESLFSVLNKFEPVSFSLIVNDTKVVSMMKRYNDLESVQREFLHLVVDKKETDDMGGKYFDKVIRRQHIKHIQGFPVEEVDNCNRVVIYAFEQERVKGEIFSRDISENSSPLAILAALLYAKNEGILKGAHLAFKIKGNDTLLSERALSDGEYLWLARLGLVLLSRYEDNLLFLFDEPDVHLNESWNSKFVKVLNQFAKRKNQTSTHDYIIATHSSLILTDATAKQLYQFIKDENGNVTINNDNISPFAADREEISTLIFGIKDAIGDFSREKIEKVMQSSSIEEVTTLIDKMGPGVARLQMRDKLYDLINEGKIRKEGSQDAIENE